MCIKYLIVNKIFYTQNSVVIIFFYAIILNNLNIFIIGESFSSKNKNLLNRIISNHRM